MAKLSERETLVGTVKRIGFGELVFTPPSPLSGCDLALRSPCFQAFVKHVRPSDSLLESWSEWQANVAEYRRASESAPRDLYLVLLADQANTSATLENIDQISKDTLVCRKIVCILNGEGFRPVVETWPFLTFASGTGASARALVSVLDSFKDSGYNPEVLDIFTKWISAEQARMQLLTSVLPSEVPELRFSNYAKELPVSEEAPHRLGLLSVKDFRGIRQMDIDLSADLVVIHGRNGTGKTSFFDALEWVMLGEVEHLGAAAAEADGRTPFINLFSDDGIAKVSLQLLTPNGLVTLQRSTDLGKEEMLRFAGKSFADDRYALIEVLGEQARNLNIGSLRDLIRSTNFLAQSTLKRFFSKKPGERYAAVSHLLGTHDYEKFLNKLFDVKSEFSKNKLNNERELGVLSDTIGTKNSELARISAQLIDSPIGAELDRRLEETLRLIESTLKEFHSEVATISINQPFLFEEIQAFLDVAAEWRRVNVTATETHLEELAFIQQSEVLLKEQEDQTRMIRAELLALDLRYDNLRSDLQKHENGRRTLEETISRLRGDVQLTTSTLGSLQQLMTILDREEQVRKSAAAYQQRIAELTIVEEQQRSAREAAQATSEQSLARRKQISTELEALQAQLQALAVLKGRASEVPRYREELERTRKAVEASEVSIVSKQSELDDTAKKHAEIVSTMQSTVSAVDATRSSMQECKALLSSFRKYVRESDCPLCGHHYGSSEELRHRIDHSLENDPPDLKRLETDLQVLRQKLKVIESSQDQLRTDIAQAAATIRTGRNRADEITRDLAELEALAARLQIGDDLGSSEAIDERIRTMESQFRSHSQEVVQLDLQYAVQSGEQSRIESQLRFTMDELQAATAAVNRTLGDLSNLIPSRTELTRALSLPDLKNLPDRNTATAQLLSETTEALAAQEQDRAVLDGKLRTIQAELASVLKQKSPKEEQLRALSLDMEQLKARRANVNKYDPLTVTGRRDESARTLTRMNELETDIERARKQASWLLARREVAGLSDQIAALSETHDNMRNSHDQDVNWERHLDHLEGTITRARHEAENWQLANYGPSIGNLYKRFSAHPIFGSIDVTVDPSSEEIHITADVNNFVSSYLKHPLGKLAPLQYFSEAQTNVLALSVFLSNAFQQRWSKFNSVFMDDPVQNMDDLNSNAFIDTLRALTSTSGRQFVVATCNLQLYKLMLVKLTCLNTGAKQHFSAYRFDGTSIEGPHMIKDV